MTLLQAPAKPGLKLMPLDYGRVLDLLHSLQHGGVSYGMGCKATQHDGFPAFDFPPQLPDGRIDCSGFARVAIYHATAGAILIPDGSANQNDYMASEGYKRTDYSNCELRDGYVRAAFCRHEDGHAYGHVWLCHMGYTAESYGGVGPGSRPVTTPVLERIVSDCYVIGYSAPAPPLGLGIGA